MGHQGRSNWASSDSCSSVAEATSRRTASSPRAARATSGVNPAVGHHRSPDVRPPARSRGTDAALSDRRIEHVEQGEYQTLAVDDADRLESTCPSRHSSCLGGLPLEPFQQFLSRGRIEGARSSKGSQAHRTGRLKSLPRLLRESVASNRRLATRLRGLPTGHRGRLIHHMSSGAAKAASSATASSGRTTAIRPIDVDRVPRLDRVVDPRSQDFVGKLAPALDSAAETHLTAESGPRVRIVGQPSHDNRKKRRCGGAESQPPRRIRQVSPAIAASRLHATNRCAGSSVHRTSSQYAGVWRLRGRSRASPTGCPQQRRAGPDVPATLDTVGFA